MKVNTIKYLLFAFVYMLLICACTAIADEPLIEEIKYEPFPEEERAISDEALAQTIRNTETMLKMSTGGIPLVLPLVEYSDHSLFLIPVSGDSTMLAVERLYLLDFSNPDSIIDYRRDLYKVDTLYYYVYDEDNPYRVGVSRDAIYKTYIIDSFQFYEIRKINRKKSEFPVKTRIPEVKIYSDTPK